MKINNKWVDSKKIYLEASENGPFVIDKLKLMGFTPEGVDLLPAICHPYILIGSNKKYRVINDLKAFEESPFEIMTVKEFLNHPIEYEFKAFDRVMVMPKRDDIEKDEPLYGWQPFFFSYEKGNHYHLMGGLKVEKSEFYVIPWDSTLQRFLGTREMMSIKTLINE